MWRPITTLLSASIRPNGKRLKFQSIPPLAMRGGMDGGQKYGRVIITIIMGAVGDTNASGSSKISRLVGLKTAQPGFFIFMRFGMIVKQWSSELVLF